MNLLAARDQPTLEDFGHDVWWIVLIKVVGIFVLLVVHDAVRDRVRAQGRRPDAAARSARTGSARAATCRPSPTA